MHLRPWIVIVAIMGCSGVALGAYHAHGLEKRLARNSDDPTAVQKRLDQFGSGVRYQMYHSAAMLGLLALASRRPTKWAKISAVLFMVGVVLFSGSLYALALTQIMTFAHIAPFGGLTLMLAWLSLVGAVAPGVAPDAISSDH